VNDPIAVWDNNRDWFTPVIRNGWPFPERSMRRTVDGSNRRLNTQPPSFHARTLRGGRVIE
jgi:hypothetical protein